MQTKVKIIIFLAVTTLFITSIYFMPEISSFIRWRLISHEAKAATSSFPMQFGLINTIMIKCAPVPTAMNCPQHRLCAMKPPTECGNYTVITGQPAGGNGSEIVVDTIQYSMSGYKLGDNVIAAGISDALIQVIATPGGCYGCQ